MQNEQNHRLLSIVRDGIPLGVFSEEEVRELLAAGLLQPTDGYRRPEESNWKQLAKIEVEAGEREQRVPWLKRVSQSVSSAAGAMAHKAGDASVQVKSFVLTRKTELTEGWQRVLNDYLPQIRKRVADQLVVRPASSIRSALRDDELMRKIFGAVYDCLPKPIYRFVPEAVFIKFCFQNKARLFDAHPAPDEQLGPPRLVTDKPTE